MKTGSIIELVNDQNWNNKYPVPELPKIGRLYTVRGFDRTGYGVYLEEIKGRNYVGHETEAAWLKSRFREVLPPMKIEIESVIEEPIKPR